MKEYKHRYGFKIIGICVYIFIGVLLFAFVGCDYFNRPMLAYLEYWTNAAQIGKHEFDDSYPKTNEFVNLPSGADRVIKYYLTNPQNYDLDVTVKFADPDLGMASNSTPSDFAVIEQSTQDKNIIYLTLKNGVGAIDLLSLDGEGKDISPTVVVTEPSSGRNFGSYTIPIRVNSAPSPILYPVVLRSNTAQETYVICFNLPEMTGKDRDLEILTVSAPFERTYTINPDGSLAGGSGEVVTTYNENWQPITVAGEEGAVFTGDKKKHFFALVTGLPLSDTKISFTLTLTDTCGLTSAVNASSQAPKLETVTATPESGEIEVDSKVVFSSNVPESTVHVTSDNYTGIIDENGKPVTGEITGSGSVTLTFKRKGTYTVTAWSVLAGYATSERIDFTYQVKGVTPGIEVLPDLGKIYPKATVSQKGQKYTVSVSGLPEQATIVRVSVHGREVLRKAGVQNEYDLPEGIPAGTYPLEVIFTYNGVGYNTVIEITIP